MPEIDLMNLYSEMQQEMLKTLDAGSVAFLHPGTKGDNTEANWVRWFRTYLPARYAVDKAIVIDANGRESHQMDLVIYDAQYSYLVFEQQGSKLIPAESVYAVFEVKQNLNKTHMEYAQEKAGSVRALTRSSATIRHAGGEYRPKPLHQILAGLLTTRSDWSGQVAEHVGKHIAAEDAQKHLDFVCAISGGAFVVDHNPFRNQFDPAAPPAMRYCENNASLVFFLLNLLKRLQDIGTVPAIDYMSYARGIHAERYTDHIMGR